MRWVNAIWTALERTRSLPRPSSLHTNRSSGSASTHYANSINSPALGPRQTTDDAVISTASGLTAPLVQRGSRRLAQGRSLRRVASEADLSETASNGGTPDVADVGPLTVDAAVRPSSRDFTFARGLLPPVLTPPTSVRGDSEYKTAVASLPDSATSRPSSLLNPTQNYSATEIKSISGYTEEDDSAGGRQATTAESFAPGDTAFALSASEYRTAAVVPSQDLRSDSLFGTSQIPALYRTVRAETSVTRDVFDSPLVSRSEFATGTTRGDTEYGSAHYSSTVRGVPPSYLGDNTQLTTGTVAHSPDISSYHTASIGSGAIVQYQRNSITSNDQSAPTLAITENTTTQYLTAVTQSSYETAPLAVQGLSTPVRYQLHDAPVQTLISQNTDTHDSPLSPLSTTIGEESQHTVSEYSTAPPPPISRDSSYVTAIDPISNLESETNYYYTAFAPTRIDSFHSTVQEPASQDGWETATRISEPDADEDILADLERSSSSGTLNKSARYATPFSRSQFYTARETMYTVPYAETSMYSADAP